MQNQLQYPPSFPSQNNHKIQQQPKYSSPNHFKTQDRSLPIPNLKHYGSNPNITPDLNALKSSQMTADSQQLPTSNLKKNGEFRSPPSHGQYNYSQQPPHRGMRGPMSQSLIVGEQNNTEVPE